MDSGEPQREFWEKMAERYPLPFDSEQLAHTERMMGVAEGFGVRVEGSRVLDVGCGTGVYALPLAQRAAQVVGLDISEEMTRRFTAVCRERGIDNATVIRAPWGDAVIDEFELEQAFDIVWAALIPTVRGRQDVARLSRCSRKWCVYVGWNGSRTNPFLEAVFRAHGQPFGPPPGAGEVQTCLAELGMRSQKFTTVRSWEWEESAADATAYANRFLTAHTQATPDARLIEDIVAGLAVDGVVRHRADVEEALLVWDVTTCGTREGPGLVCS